MALTTIPTDQETGLSTLNVDMSKLSNDGDACVIMTSTQGIGSCYFYGTWSINQYSSNAIYIEDEDSSVDGYSLQWQPYTDYFNYENSLYCDGGSETCYSVFEFCLILNDGGTIKVICDKNTWTSFIMQHGGTTQPLYW